LSLAMELLALVSAAMLLAVGVASLGLWAWASILSRTSRTIAFVASAGLVVLEACFGLATWIFLVIERGKLRDFLDPESGIILGRERIIAVGSACWVIVLLTQVALTKRD